MWCREAGRDSCALYHVAFLVHCRLCFVSNQKASSTVADCRASISARDPFCRVFLTRRRSVLGSLLLAGATPEYLTKHLNCFSPRINQHVTLCAIAATLAACFCCSSNSRRQPDKVHGCRQCYRLEHLPNTIRHGGNPEGMMNTSTEFHMRGY